MRVVSQILGDLRAAEVALVVLLGGVMVGAALLLTRPAMLEAFFRLPTAEQLAGGRGGPSQAPPPDRR